MTTPQLLRRSAIALIGLEVGLASTYFLLIWRHGTTISLLDFNGLRSLPSMMQAAHLFAIAAVCLVLLIQRHRLSRPCSRYLPLALAGLSILGGIDELTKLHLTLDQINWKLLYLGLLVAIPILSWRDLIWLWQAHRATLVWIAAGLAIFSARRLWGRNGAGGDRHQRCRQQFVANCAARRTPAHHDRRICRTPGRNPHPLCLSGLHGESFDQTE